MINKWDYKHSIKSYCGTTYLVKPFQSKMSISGRRHYQRTTWKLWQWLDLGCLVGLH